MTWLRDIVAAARIQLRVAGPGTGATARAENTDAMPEGKSAARCRPPSALSVVVLTNTIPAYRLSTIDELAARMSRLVALISAGELASNLAGIGDLRALNVLNLRHFVFRRVLHHPDGYRERVDVQVPWNVVPKLYSLAPDVIVASELGLRTLQALLYTWLRPRARLIIHADLSEDTERVYGRLRGAFRRFLLNRGHLVIVNGTSGARYVRAFGVPDARLSVIPYATDQRFLSVARDAAHWQGLRRLIYVGQFIERKGLLPFIAALSEWCRRHPERRIEFQLIGAGPLRAAIEAAPRAPNLVVQVMNRVDYNDLPQRYAEADIAVLPTLADTWAVSVNEAMGVGLPMLGSTRSQAVSELVTEGINGWRFDSTQPGSMDEAINRALTVGNEKLVDMGAEARRRAAEVSAPQVATCYELAIRGLFRG